MKIKKQLALLAAAVLSLGMMSGCGSKDSEAARTVKKKKSRTSTERICALTT